MIRRLNANATVTVAKGARIAAGASLSFAGAALYAALMRGIWAAEALGPICRHGGALALHCPACPAALAMMATGLFVASGAGERVAGDAAAR